MVGLPVAEAVRDLRENHARAVTADFVQRLTGLVGALAQSVIPVAGAATLLGPEKVASVSIASTGPAFAWACPPKRRRRVHRPPMGAQRLHLRTARGDGEDKNQGKTAFWNTMVKEVATVKARYPGTTYTGLSDGASDLLPWLRVF